MKLLRAVAYPVCLLLILFACNVVLKRWNIPSGYFWAQMISCASLFVIIVYLPVRLLWLAFGKSRTLAVPLLVSLAIAGIGELIFAYWLNHPATIPARLRWAYDTYYDYYDCRLIQFQRGCSEYDPALFYRLAHNSAFFFSNREFSNLFSVNRAGTRDDEHSLAAPRIICLGDSYAMGWGVEQEEAFPQKLERLSGMKVLNAGISSYGTAREVLQAGGFDTSALECLVIQYCGNDDEENEQYVANGFRLQVSSQTAFDSLRTDHYWVRKYFPGKHFLTISSLFLKHEINKIRPLFRLQTNRDEETPAISEKDQALNFMKILAHAPLPMKKLRVIVTVMNSPRYMKTEFLNEVKLLSRDPRFQNSIGELVTLDLSPVLGRSDFYTLDAHVNAAGHLKIAQQLLPLVQPGLEGDSTNHP